MISWDALDQEGRDPAGVVASAKSFGLANGMSYSVGSAASRTMSGLTKSGDPFTKSELDELVTFGQLKSTI